MFPVHLSRQQSGRLRGPGSTCGGRHQAGLGSWEGVTQGPAQPLSGSCRPTGAQCWAGRGACSWGDMGRGVDHEPGSKGDGFRWPGVREETKEGGLSCSSTYRRTTFIRRLVCLGHVPERGVHGEIKRPRHPVFSVRHPACTRVCTCVCTALYWRQERGFPGRERRPGAGARVGLSSRPPDPACSFC